MQNEKVMELAKELAEKHMTKFIHGVTDLVKDFVMPLDMTNETDGEEVGKYVLDVLRAVDNLVLVTTQQHDNEMAVKACELSTQLLYANLVQYHSKDKVKH